MSWLVSEIRAHIDFSEKNKNITTDLSGSVFYVK